MFRCKACTRRTLRALFANVFEQPSLSSIRGQSGHLRQSWRRQHRSYASAASTSTSLHTSDHAFSAEPIPFTRRNLPTPSSNPQAGNLEKNQSKLQEPTIFKQGELERELRWLRDPLKLGDRIVALLREDLYFKALALVRLASKDLLCTVSWNHLVDWNMTQGRVTPAIKVYNEMKKRAQAPDARTFTTLFRGFAWHVKRVPSSLEKALSIYHSMFADNSPVKPSIIHTNAVINVCATAGDMDAVLGVAARLPERGNGAPDTLTYTVILNALRNSALSHRFQNSDLKSVKREGAVVVGQGRKLWEEIRARWVKGDLLVDEELVCAMGRVLLLGGEEDADDVLSLLEQTMAIPRQVARIGDPARYGHGPKPKPPRNDDEENSQLLLPQQSSNQSSPAIPAHLPSLNAHTAASSLFAPLPKLAESSSSVRPGRITLSLALEACIRMYLLRPAQDYWGLLTAPAPTGHAINPDTENYHTYLRLLRLQRASKLAASLVEDIKMGRLLSKGDPRDRIKLEPKIFRMAMSACARDKQNLNALGYANGMVRTMLATFEDADAPTMTSYLQCAVRGHSKGDWRVLIEVEVLASQAWQNLKSLIAYGDFDEDRDNGGAERGRRRGANGQALEVKPTQDVLEFAQTFVALYDRILSAGREEIDKQNSNALGKKKAKVGAWVRRMIQGRGENSPSFSSLSGSEESSLKGRERKTKTKTKEEHSRGEEEEFEDEERNAPENAATTQDPARRTLRQHSASFSFKPRVRNSDDDKNADPDEDDDGEEEVDQGSSNTRPRHRFLQQIDNSRLEFAPDPRPRERRGQELGRRQQQWMGSRSRKGEGKGYPSSLHAGGSRDENLPRRHRDRRRSETGLKSDFEEGEW